MWIDDQGSEVLVVPECRRLVAMATKEHRHGHLGVPQVGAQLVLPVSYAVHGPGVVLRIGEGLFEQLDARLVAFQVDGSRKAASRAIKLTRHAACLCRAKRSRIVRRCR